jgi:hypothetical protein
MGPMTKAMASAAVALVTVASAATAQTPPTNIPTPPGADVARFQMTIHGTQFANYRFSWTPAPSGCSRHSEGTLREQWQWARGKSVVMEFMKFPGGHVIVQRHGRFGDASFAAPGSLERHATGFYDFGGEPGCGGTYSLVSGTCEKLFKVQSDLRFFWNGRKLTLDRAGTRLRKNPAADCGNPNGALNFTGLTFPYPLVSKQKGALTKREIFGHQRGIAVNLQNHFLEPLEPNPEVNKSEHVNGRSTVTLKRLRD